MAHEDLTRDQHVEGSSDRAFGLVFAACSSGDCCWPLFHGEIAAMVGAWCGRGVRAGCAVLKPALLAGLNRLWTKLGVLLGKVVSPIALGVLFYGVLTPIGALMRLHREGSAAPQARCRRGLVLDTAQAARALRPIR